MPTPPERLGEVCRWCYHLAVLAVGLIIATIASADAVRGHPGWTLPVALLVGVPLIAVIARFPMALDRG